MHTVTRSIVVPAPPADVWAVLADFAGIVAWAPNVDHSCLLTDQTEGVGAVRRIQAGRTTLVERATEWEPPARLSYSLEGLPKVLKRVTSTWVVEADDDGARVTLSTDVDAGPRPPQRLIAKGAGKRLAKASDEMLAGLKERVT